MASTINVEIFYQLKEVLEDDFSLVVDGFINEGSQLMQTTEEGIAANDFDAVRHATHSMKSLGGNLGAMQLSNMADKFQVAAAQEDIETLVSDWPIFSQLYLDALEEIRELQ